MKRDHGGNLDWAVARFGGPKADWIDLSTGINRVPYPVPAIAPEAWTALPTSSATRALIEAAGRAFDTACAILPLAGAQAAIQLVPLLAKPGLARIMAPTYNEHAAALRALGWTVEEAPTAAATAGADLAVIVNPNNPDGRHHDPQSLLALLPRVGRLVVDESFGDPYPQNSLAPHAGQPGLLVLRSFGKFYGLAGLRLGFALGAAADIAALAERAGPWPVCGPALEIGAQALADTAWAAATIARLNAEIPRLDALAATAGWELVGGTNLFRLYATPDAEAARAKLAARKIWSRAFPYSAHWLRLGFPGTPAEWDRLARALGED